MKELSDRDARLLSDLCARAGAATVIHALSEYCAFQASDNTPAAAKWEEVHRALFAAAQIAADVDLPT